LQKRWSKKPLKKQSQDTNQTEPLAQVEVAQTSERSTLSGKRTVHWEDDELFDKPATPNQRLVYAVLGRAIADLARPERHIKNDAIRWIFSNNTEKFSFLWSLDVLDINASPQELRQLARQILRNHDPHKQ